MERELTGKWYIKKTFFGFKVMVQIVVMDVTFSRVCVYVEATTEELIELDIHVI